MKDTAIVVHWWNDNPSIRPYQDFSNPIILAVACVRVNNPTIPIYVIDTSACKRPDSSWYYYPYKLGFKVIKADSFLRELEKEFKKLYNTRLLSRVWDVELAMRNVPENIIMFMDADIFCLNPLVAVVPEGKLVEHFYASNNNGIWVYDKRAGNAKLLFDTWKGTICRVFHDDDFRREIFAHNPGYGTFVMQDEIIYRALVTLMQNEVRSASPLDNYLFYWLYVDEPKVIDQIRGLHCLSFITGTDRRRLFLVLRELWAQIVRVFDDNDMRLIFEGRLPQETMSLKEFYYSAEAIDKFLSLVGNPRSCFHLYTANMGFCKPMRLL